MKYTFSGVKLRSFVQIIVAHFLIRISNTRSAFTQPIRFAVGNFDKIYIQHSRHSDLIPNPALSIFITYGRDVSAVYMKENLFTHVSISHCQLSNYARKFMRTTLCIDEYLKKYTWGVSVEGQTCFCLGGGGHTVQSPSMLYHFHSFLYHF
jgi:hypothetical protein